MRPQESQENYQVTNDLDNLLNRMSSQGTTRSSAKHNRCKLLSKSQVDRPLLTKINPDYFLRLQLLPHERHSVQPNGSTPDPQNPTTVAQTPHRAQCSTKEVHSGLLFSGVR